MTVCLVTDRQRLCPGARTERAAVSALVAWLTEAVEAGVDLIQIRERDLSARALRTVAWEVTAVAAGGRTRVLVNDRADVALAAGCAGVHLRGDSPPASRVRRVGPASWLVSRAVHDEADLADLGPVDLAVFGAVFPTGTKPARGLEALRRVAARCGVPVLAIGGVTADNAAACLAAGAAGVAAISIFLPEGGAPGALGVRRAVTRLRAAIDPASTRPLQLR